MRRHWQRRPLLVRSAIKDIVATASRARAVRAGSARGCRVATHRSQPAGMALRSRAVRALGLAATSPTRLDAARARRRPAPRRGACAVAAVSLRARRAARRPDDLVGQRWRRRRPARRQLRRVPAAGAGEPVAHRTALRPALDERAPLKVLRRFEPEQEFVLAPGDLLYLPPNWAHEGVAVGGDCMTCSIGMRAPQRGALAGELAQRWPRPTTSRRSIAIAATTARRRRPPSRRRSRASRATPCGASRPTGAVERALGEVMSEPKPRRLVHEAHGTVAPAAPSCSTAARACSTTRAMCSSTARPRRAAAATHSAAPAREWRALDAGTFAARAGP